VCKVPAACAGTWSYLCCPHYYNPLHADNVIISVIWINRKKYHCTREPASCFIVSMAPINTCIPGTHWDTCMHTNACSVVLTPSSSQQMPFFSKQSKKLGTVLYFFYTLETDSMDQHFKKIWLSNLLPWTELRCKISLSNLLSGAG